MRGEDVEVLCGASVLVHGDGLVRGGAWEGDPAGDGAVSISPPGPCFDEIGAMRGEGPEAGADVFALDVEVTPGEGGEAVPF